MVGLPGPRFGRAFAEFQLLANAEQVILMVTAYVARVPGTMPSNATQAKRMARAERLAASGMRRLRY